MQNLQCYMAFHHYLNSKFWTVSFLEHFLVYKQHELHKLNAAEAQAWGHLGARPQTPTLLSAAGASTLPVPLLAQLLQTHGPNGRSSSPHLLPKKTQERQTTTQQQNSSPNTDMELLTNLCFQSPDWCHRHPINCWGLPSNRSLAELYRHVRDKARAPAASWKGILVGENYNSMRCDLLLSGVSRIPVVGLCSLPGLQGHLVNSCPVHALVLNLLVHLNHLI